MHDSQLQVQKDDDVPYKSMWDDGFILDDRKTKPGKCKTLFLLGKVLCTIISYILNVAYCINFESITRFKYTSLVGIFHLIFFGVDSIACQL